MSTLSDKYTKNFSSAKKAEFNKRFRNDYDAAKSELSNILMILAEMRELGFSKGGLIDKPLGAGGKKSGPPPKKGQSSKGLNIKNNTVKTV